MSLSTRTTETSQRLRTQLTTIHLCAETVLAGRYRSAEQMHAYLSTILRACRKLDLALDDMPGNQQSPGDHLDSDIFRLGAANIALNSREITIDGRPVHLSPRAWALLKLFLTRPNRVLSRTEIKARIWSHAPNRNPRAIDTCVAQLRAVLEPTPAHPRYILTVRGSGYRLSLRQQE